MFSIKCSNGVSNRKLKLCSWNIGGAKHKLNINQILEFLHNYDIIWILESKQIQSTNVPGFLVYHNASRHGNHRGGVMLLVKHAFKDYLENINISLESQIWFELSCYPNTRFGGVYIPPEDSQYYDQSIIANMYVQMNGKEKVVILGDFNAHVGRPEMKDSKDNLLEYINVNNTSQNAPGKRLINMCKDRSLVIVNHLKYNNKSYGGNLSYRKGGNWISELDLCIANEYFLPLIDNVEIRQDVSGSDHAPLCVTTSIPFHDLIAPLLLNRAKNLGQSFFTDQPNQGKILLKTEPRNKVNIINFENNLAHYQPPQLTSEDLDSALTTSLNIIHKCAKKAKLESRNLDENNWDQSQPRWKNLLENNDSKTIWKAIDWKGKISDENGNQPDSEQFKLHFEDLLNTDQEDQPDIDLSDSPYMPVVDDPFTLGEMNNALKDLKAGKSYTGICPGLFVRLPLVWLMFFLTLFNIAFQGFYYPVQWTYSKLITLFKSGDRLCCGNYRGISIMDTMAKI